MNIAAAGCLVNAKDFSTKTRKSMAKRGTAKPDGSYPIEDSEDVHNAVMDYNRSSDATPSDKAHIRKRAKALGMGDPFGEVKAGGPGSGRHPEGGRTTFEKMHHALTKRGWNPVDGKRGTYQHPTKGTASLQPGYVWHHTKNGQRVGSGVGVDSFKSHFGIK
jgi:hypothetical protein